MECVCTLTSENKSFCSQSSFQKDLIFFNITNITVLVYLWMLALPFTNLLYTTLWQLLLVLHKERWNFYHFLGMMMREVLISSFPFYFFSRNFLAPEISLKCFVCQIWRGNIIKKILWFIWIPVGNQDQFTKLEQQVIEANLLSLRIIETHHCLGLFPKFLRENFPAPV